jgi:DNA-binding XRE family transcriptional regulator
MNNLIYGLRNPINDTYYYIGKTTIGKDRPISHLHYSHNAGVRKWVNELNKVGIEPFIDIIEEGIEIDLLGKREEYWITEFKKINEELLNIRSVKKDVSTLSELSWEKLDDAIEVLSDIPLLVKSIRLKYNLRQDELAKLCGVGRCTISRIENTEDNSKSILLIRKLLDYYSK